MLSSEQYPAEMFVRFVDTFSADNRPEILSMSGGEAMLRPKLVRELAERARKVGTRSTVLSGMFFASSARNLPPLIKEAIEALDHFSVSLDVFHEREVPRAHVFNVIETLLTAGTDVSIHVVGQDADDPYLESITDEVQRVFDSKVPMLVNRVRFFGRARSWFAQDLDGPLASTDADPCQMAAWPVVGFDGTIVTCGNDDVIDNPPTHLLLGHVDSDDWSTIRERCLGSSMVRAIRLFGPEYIADRFRESGLGCDGYCQTCMKLTHDPSLERRVENIMARPSVAVLEEQASAMQRRAGAVAFARRYGLPRYAELTTLGAPT